VATNGLLHDTVLERIGMPSDRETARAASNPENA
jgi:hypothetical protein